ncbi:hypothetical protein A0J61_07021 [Choanephora cucurbitarum]|uniref:Uncharacterized protein n=1 Tax=Choanephora cucurbitarum TaxID=101091 RepID=A0A1C7N7A3_9FUNG|nr:hypothetical protein A0J61_07021 [Choanephora cucurbitarum]
MTSIRFPPATLSSKLSTKMLRKTSDQVEPSYLEDVAYWPSDLNESDNESECYTTTTSSTSGKHNIYQFYRQQQALHQLEPILCIQSVDSQIVSVEPKKKKKRLVLIKRLMMKMRDAAERPFQSIDHHF